MEELMKKIKAIESAIKRMEFSDGGYDYYEKAKLKKELADAKERFMKEYGVDVNAE